MSTDAELPVDRVLPEVLRAARGGPFVLVAPPGAGKTTRVPLALLPEVHGQILLLEPRRVAARAAARRMAQTLGEPVGQTVGWQVRFERVASEKTRILVVTEGILLRRLVADPLLDGVGCVLLDELHERGIDVDLSLALVREVREARPELVVGAMSATLDPGPVSEFLGGATLVRSEGRAFPVEVEHLARPDDRPTALVVADAIRRELPHATGDLLVFLPGVGEIRRVQALLPELDTVPLYGDLSPEDQDAALQPGSGRRVLLATNVAETSVTVPGVRVVIDSGRVRRARQDAETGLDRLDLEWVSRASADQRAGRAGRVAAGRALRLWTQRHHQQLEAFEPPEIERVDLAQPALTVLSWGADPATFQWFRPPPPAALDEALRLLGELGALQGRGLSPLGRRLAALPVHPRLGRLLLAAEDAGATDDGALAAAILSSGPLRSRTEGPPTSSDLLDALDAFRAGRADPGFASNVRRTRDRLRAMLPRSARSGAGDEALSKAVLAAWPDRVARRRGSEGRARMVGGRGVVLDGSKVDRELFVCLSILDGTPDARVSAASAVQPEWLSTQVVVTTAFDVGDGAVRSFREVRYRDLVLQRHPAPTDLAHAADVLVAEAVRVGLQPAAESHQQLLVRWARAHDWAPDEVPAVDPEAVLRLLAPGCTRLGELRAGDWSEAAARHLGWSTLQQVDRLAPERVTVPSGSRVALQWAASGAPVLAVRIQELFGLATTPTVGRGRVRVVLHLLGPNGRPQQVTDDLDGFWDRTWPEVRKELRARYPRHAWPEDPRAAAPQSRPARRPPR
jgi:ATP-dependent helicase HrpB